MKIEILQVNSARLSGTTLEFVASAYSFEGYFGMIVDGAYGIAHFEDGEFIDFKPCPKEEAIKYAVGNLNENKAIEVKEFKNLFKKFRANAIQLFEGVGLAHLITTDIKFEEKKSGMVCKVKHLQRSRQGLKEIERVFVRFYIDSNDNFDFYGEDENGERINLFLIQSRIIGED